MKTCFIAHLGDMSGANRSLVELADSILKEGNQVIILIPQKGELSKTLEKLNIDYKYILSASWLGNKKKEKFYKKIGKIIINYIAEYRYFLFFKKNKETINIVHFNSLIFGVGAKSLNKLNIPYVWHIRELPEDTFGLTFYNKKKSFKLVTKSKKIFAISKTIQNKFSNDFSMEKIHLIYNGVNLNGNSLNIRKDKFNSIISILIIGAVSPDKGQLEAVKAIGYLVHYKKIKSLKLNIVGKIIDKNYFNEIKEYIIDEDLEEYIIFHGYYSDVRKFRKENEIALICSKMEAFGRVTVEAMLSNQIVIGANTGGTAEIIEHLKTGLLYNQEDYIDLAEKIEFIILNHNHMIKIINKANKTAIEKYNIQRTAIEVINQYKIILNY